MTSHVVLGEQIRFLDSVSELLLLEQIQLLALDYIRATSIFCKQAAVYPDQGPEFYDPKASNDVHVHHDHGVPRVCGLIMSRRTFWISAAAVVIIIIVATLGGGLGAIIYPDDGCIKYGYIECGYIEYGYIEYDYIDYGYIKYGYIKYGYINYGYIEYLYIEYGYVKYGDTLYY
ncbi:hypothetical protein V8E54_009866 [Elaphomyces granulatus]